jgi:hypothetical protein
LIEDAPNDAYWGTGSAKGGGGKNMLGLILEEVREVLRVDAPKRRELEEAMESASSHIEEDNLAYTVLPAEAYVQALLSRLGL